MSLDDPTLDNDKNGFITCSYCGIIVEPSDDDTFRANEKYFCDDDCHQRYLDL